MLPVTPVADNRVSASERTATTVQVCRSAARFSAASLAIYWMDVHICAPFQLRSVPTLRVQVDLAIFAYLPDPTNISRKIEVCDHVQSRHIDVR